MFAKACERVYKFTRPLIISTRTVDGTVSSSCGTFIIINPEGWILTAGHLFDSFVKYQQDMKKIKEVEEINARKASMAVQGAMTHTARPQMDNQPFVLVGRRRSPYHQRIREQGDRYRTCEIGWIQAGHGTGISHIQGP